MGTHCCTESVCNEALRLPAFSAVEPSERLLQVLRKSEASRLPPQT